MFFRKTHSQTQQANFTKRGDSCHAEAKVDEWDPVKKGRIGWLYGFSDGLRGHGQNWEKFEKYQRYIYGYAVAVDLRIDLEKALDQE